MNWDWTIWVTLAGLALLLLSALAWYLTRPLPKLPEAPSLPLPLEPIHLQFDSSIPIHKHSRVYDEQSSEWKASLQSSGKVLKSQKISEIILLHGTFVGSDPINILSGLKTVLPKVSQHVEQGISRKVRELIDNVAQDNGNFIPSYAELLEKALGGEIPVGLFYWSSSNNHLGRLEGALGLLQRFAKDQNTSAHTRRLLIGHSHARQVFALFTQFWNAAGEKAATGSSLWEFVENEGLVNVELQKQISDLKKLKLKFDFVTLGGPVRYQWSYLPDMRVLHIVNHHGETTQTPNAWTFWNTSSGDYVQQWGMIGSDNIAPTPRERHLNRKLDEILGKGLHTRLWFQSLFRRERLGDFGRTLLIDYFHAQRQKTNFVKTVFGHGVYTRFDVMQFQLELICRYMYGKK